jgi:hypothetical protein
MAWAAGRSPASRRHELLRVALALNRDCRNRPLYLCEIVSRELDARSPNILFKPMQLGGAGDGHDPRPLHQQPGERDLSWRRLLLLGDPLEKVDQRLVQRGIGNLLDIFGPAVHADLLARRKIDFEAELGGDHHLVADRR